MGRARYPHYKAKLREDQCPLPRKLQQNHDFGVLNLTPMHATYDSDAATQQVWCINRAGALDRLHAETCRLPPPPAGHVRLRVTAIGVNFADVFACLGLYSATPRGRFIPGLECAGTVEAIGPATPTSAPVAVGDRVMALTRFGAYASALNVDTRYVRAIPAGWTLAEAAAFPVQALTAWYGLVRLGRAGAGQVLLVHSLAGGVGLHALNLARRIGATVIGTVGDAHKRDWLVRERHVAADAVIVRDRRRFGKQIDDALRAAGAGSVDLVFDAVLGPFFRPAYDRLAAEGRYIVYGAADFMPSGSRPNWLRLAPRYVRRPTLDPLGMIASNRCVAGFNLIWLWDRIDRLAEGFDEVRALAPEPPQIGTRFPFSEAPRAMRALQSGRTIGKVILEI